MPNPSGGGDGKHRVFLIARQPGCRKMMVRLARLFSEQLIVSLVADSYHQGGENTVNMGRFLILLSMFTFAMASVLMTSNNSADAYILPDSGQTLCYDDFGYVISCHTTGQDGEYNINSMNFTSNGDYTVTDNNTGLIWKKCSVGQNDDATCSGTAATFNWYQATGTEDATYNPVGSYRNACGELSGDWRLPTKR